MCFLQMFQSVAGLLRLGITGFMLNVLSQTAFRPLQ
jgi:hypothetical protein